MKTSALLLSFNFLPMKYAISLLFSFLCLAEVKGEDINPDAQTFLVRRGDSISYPISAKLVEVSALMNGLFYNCTIMPGDSFKVLFVTNYDSGKSKIVIQKIKGAPGDWEICHRGSLTNILGVNRLSKTKKGFPIIVTKIFYPFVIRWTPEIRNTIEKEDHPSPVEAILIREGALLTYPASAPKLIIGGDLVTPVSSVFRASPKPPVFRVSYKTIDFNCTVAPGDSFKTLQITNYRSGGAGVFLEKTGGAEGNEEICPLGTKIYNEEVKNCKLIRTETGIPSAIKCRYPLNNLLGSPVVERKHSSFINSIKDFVFLWE